MKLLLLLLLRLRLRLRLKLRLRLRLLQTLRPRLLTAGDRDAALANLGGVAGG